MHDADYDDWLGLLIKRAPLLSGAPIYRAFLVDYQRSSRCELELGTVRESRLVPLAKHMRRCGWKRGKPSETARLYDWLLHATISMSPRTFWHLDEGYRSNEGHGY